jgi:hypothetical protein
MQRLQRFLYVAAYGTVLGTLLSIFCWAVVLGVWYVTFSTNPDLGGRLFTLAYGGFLGVAFGAKLAVWTGTTTALAAATITSVFAFPLKHPENYRQLMQVICPVVATVCTLLVAEGELGTADYPIRIITIVIAACVSFLVSRYLASWSIARSRAIP